MFIHNSYDSSASSTKCSHVDVCGCWFFANIGYLLCCPQMLAPADSCVVSRPAWLPLAEARQHRVKLPSQGGPIYLGDNMSVWKVWRILYLVRSARYSGLSSGRRQSIPHDRDATNRPLACCTYVQVQLSTRHVGSSRLLFFRTKGERAFDTAIFEHCCRSAGVKVSTRRKHSTAGGAKGVARQLGCIGGSRI